MACAHSQTIRPTVQHVTVDPGQAISVISTGPVSIGAFQGQAIPIVSTGTLSVTVAQSSVQVYNVPGSSLPVRQNWIGGFGTFTATASSGAFNVSLSPLKNFGIQVVQTGSVTSWDARLEGSIDGTNFNQILQHTNVTGSGVVVWSGSNVSPSLYFRTRVAGLVLGAGTSITVYILGTE